MSKSSKNSSEEFDRSVCFTCFSSWVEAIRSIADTDPRTAITAFLVLSDFCLYGIEPDPECNPWGFTWPVVEHEARRSINNRRRGFGSEDVEQSDAIRTYYADHPYATQRAIADAVGCSVGKVNKVLKSISLPTPSLEGCDSVHGNGSGDDIGLSLHPEEQNEHEIFGSPLPCDFRCSDSIPDEQPTSTTAAEESAAFTFTEEK